MVMTSRERSSVAKPVLPGHIGISRDLQHLIGVKDLSLVKLQNVSYGPSDIKGIILNPCEDTEDKVLLLLNSQKRLRAYSCTSIVITLWVRSHIWWLHCLTLPHHHKHLP